MTEPPPTNSDAPPLAATPEAKSAAEGFWRNPSLPFAFVRICLYLILAEAISYALHLLAKPFLKVDFSLLSPRRLMESEVVALIGVFFAAWIMSRLERRPFGAYGLPVRFAFSRPFWVGSLFGLAEISSVLGVLAALGYYRFGPLALHGQQLLHWAIFWAFVFLCVGFYEEFAFRGYVQYTLAQAVGFWPAAIFLSVLFGAVHLANSGENWVGIAGVVLTGLLWCFSLQRTGSLWFAVGMHASFDFGESFLYSVPDSGEVLPGHLSNATLAGPTWLAGGSAGPEASILDFIALLVIFYLLHRLYPARSSRTIESSLPAAASPAAQ